MTWRRAFYTRVTKTEDLVISHFFGRRVKDEELDIKKFAELCHCNTYIAAVANYVNKCIDIVVKTVNLRFKMLVTKNSSLLLYFPHLHQNKQILVVIFSHSLPLLSKNFARQIYLLSAHVDIFAIH